jgi:small subunit ribosomal protein S1
MQTLVMEDFAKLLEESFAKEELERGDSVVGTIVAVDNQGLIIDIGWKRDGIVSRRDVERLEMNPEDFHVGAEIDVTIMRLEDEDGNLQLSVAQARQGEDWKRAEAFAASGELWEGNVIEANRGGLIVLFGNVRGFVPASHVADLPRGLVDDDRKHFMMSFVGKTIKLKVIEVNRKRRRLVLSQREAAKGTRDARKDVLMGELKEGDVRQGVVSGLRDFGAFVDLGGADGLIHISELAWHRVKHPKEVLAVGDEVQVFVLRLDDNGKRIGLSLKRLQQNPWHNIETLYHVGQLVEGSVSRVTQLGAFITLDPGIEALLHSSQINENNPAEQVATLQEGQLVLVRIISIEAEKQRLGLSNKDIADENRAEWGQKHHSISAVSTVG